MSVCPGICICWQAYRIGRINLGKTRIAQEIIRQLNTLLVIASHLSSVVSSYLGSLDTLRTPTPSTESSRYFWDLIALYIHRRARSDPLALILAFASFVYL